VARVLAPFLSDVRKRHIERVLAGRLLSVTLVLENLYDPHNGAAVLRSCEGFGLLNVHVVEGAEPFFFSRKVSQSAHKWLNVHLYRSVDDCLGHLRDCGFALWAAVPPPRDAAPRGHRSPVRGLPLDEPGPLALVFGNEHAGLSPRALELCPQHFSIPMQGFSESLNLSVSAAISLAQVTQARRAQLGGRRELTGEALDRLRAGYYGLSTPHAPALLLEHLRR